MQDDFKEEIIIEEPEENEKNEPKRENSQIVISRDFIPYILAIVSICLTFLKNFFAVVLATSSYTVMIVFYLIFFAGAVACALTSLILILKRDRKVLFTPDLVLSFVAIFLSFVSIL